MANLGDFTETDEVLGDYSPLPPGKYTAFLAESELLANKSGTGNYLKLKFQIMGGQYDGRFVWQNLTYTHQSDEAQRIGRKELNTLRIACGVEKLTNSTQLHGIAHTIEVKIVQDEGHDPSNVVKNYYALDSTQPVAQPATTEGGQPTTAAQPAQQQAATPDWAN